MNQQLINAFHNNTTFSDIIDASGLTNKQFEQTVIETIKKHYTVAKPIEIIDETKPGSTETKTETKTGSAELSDEQLEFIDMAMKGESIFLTAPAGCHAINTEILMYNGSIKKVQNIKQNELLMGDDSTPRKVINLISGTDTMYRITNVKKESYIVNEEHILCLKYTNKKSIRYSEKERCYIVKWFSREIFRQISKHFWGKEFAKRFFNNIIEDRVIEISVKELLSLPKSAQADLKEYKVGIEFTERNIPIDPYMIGYWLGDGHSNGQGITSQDSRILKYFAYNLPKYTCYLQYQSNYAYRINGSGTGKQGTNYFMKTLKQLKLIENKHIPHMYKCNSRENRLKLLAGLLDSDGYLVHDKCTFEFVQCEKHERLVNDIIYLARSLGFACNKQQKRTTWTYKGIKKEGIAFRTTICGAGVEEIPTLCPRKKANARKQIKDTLVSGITIEKLKKGDYYGFQVDGNNRYVMGSFTVTHNCGKSFVINETVRQLRARYDAPDADVSRVAICASTGKAASLIGGKTIHSFLGIGLAKQCAEELHERLITTRRLKAKYFELKGLKTLIIDEISMINNILLDKISRYLELIHGNEEPFGGVQMIFVGDLHQLAPVEGRYFIESASYRDLKPIVIQLTKCFRQDDPLFQQVLAEARVGKLSTNSYNMLMNRNTIDKTLFPDMEPTLICSTNREVDAINQRELNKLTTEKKVYSILPIATNAKKIEIACKLESIPEKVELAIDAQIMITTNISMGGGKVIANGSQGKIISMHDTHVNVRLIDWTSDVRIGFQKVLDPDCIDEDKNPIYLLEYLPIRLGYALTIHRCQGMTCSLLEVNLNKVFAAGQAYVAISRIRSLNGLKLIGLKKNAFIADKKIIEFYAHQ